MNQVKMIEINPVEAGWKWLYGDTWETDDGKIFIFPPGQPNKLRRLVRK